MMLTLARSSIISLRRTEFRFGAGGRVRRGVAMSPRFDSIKLEPVAFWRRLVALNDGGIAKKREYAAILSVFRQNPVVVYAIKRAPYRVSCPRRACRFAGTDSSFIDF